MLTKEKIIRMISKEIWFEFLNKNRVVPGSLSIDLVVCEHGFLPCIHYIIARNPRDIREVFVFLKEFYEERGFVLDVSEFLKSNNELKKDVERITDCGYDLHFFVEKKRKEKIIIDVSEDSIFIEEKKVLSQFSRINKLFGGAPTEIEWRFSPADKKGKLVERAYDVIREECEKIERKHINSLTESVEIMYDNLEKAINEAEKKYSSKYIFK